MYTFHTLENRNYLRAFTQVFNAISSILESQPRLVLYSSLTHSASLPLPLLPPLHLLSNCLTFEVNQIVCFFRLLSVCPLPFPFPFPFSFYFLYISISILLLQPLALYALLLLHSGRNFVGNKSPKVDIKSFCFPFFFPFCLSLVFSSLWFFFYFVFLSVCCSFLALTFTQSATSRAHCTCLGITAIEEGCEESRREAAAKGTPLLRRPVP